MCIRDSRAAAAAVLLAGESSRAMLASARVSCSDSSRNVAMATSFGQIGEMTFIQQPGILKCIKIYHNTDKYLYSAYLTEYLNSY